uniref:putative porin n=1 Tax=Ningiella ruwaisensis TaxID=2364274 RepID=UPI0010A0143E|nr:putative porin [Ningiella ruwaisensis]
MKIKAISFASLALLSASTLAQEYQFFADAAYTDYQDGDLSVLSVNTQYYFDPIKSLGPFNEFDYLITKSNIVGSYTNFDFTGEDFNTYTVSGEWYIGDFLIGGRYTDFENDDSGELRLGYLLSSNFLVDVRLPDSDAPYDALFSATYQHDLANDAYIGFTASVDEELSYFSLSSRYFAPLGGATYFAIGASYADADNRDDIWSIDGTYYFSKASSLGASVSENSIGINAQHYFTPNFSVGGGYTWADSDFTGDILSLRARYQF